MKFNLDSYFIQKYILILARCFLQQILHTSMCMSSSFENLAVPHKIIHFNLVFLVSTIPFPLAE
jgi:hypothetical protein